MLSQRGYFSTRVEYPTRKIALEMFVREVEPRIKSVKADRRAYDVALLFVLLVALGYFFSSGSGLVLLWAPLCVVLVISIVLFAIRGGLASAKYHALSSQLATAVEELATIRANEVSQEIADHFSAIDRAISERADES